MKTYRKRNNNNFITSRNLYTTVSLTMYVALFYHRTVDSDQSQNEKA